jgi:hypothetical protein
MRCDVPTHGCSGTSVEPTVRFYDLTGNRAAAPELVATYSPSRMPHEMFLWVDGPKRALLYLSTWKAGASGADLIVTDVSRARDGEFTEIAEWNGNARFTPEFRSQNVVRLHSMGVSADGTRTYVAYQGAGFFVLDSSEPAAGVPNPTLDLLTPVGSQPESRSERPATARIEVVTKASPSETASLPRRDRLMPLKLAQRAAGRLTGGLSSAGGHARTRRFLGRSRPFSRRSAGTCRRPRADRPEPRR